MKREWCLLLVAVLATIVSAEPPSWRYYQNNVQGGPGSGPYRPVPPESPPAYQPYSTINTGSPYSVQSQPAIQGPDGIISAGPQRNYLPPPGPAIQQQQQQQVQRGPSQFDYPASSQLSSLNPTVNLGFRVESDKGSLQASSAVPLPFGGMQSFYFSPKERALYQVMKIMLSPDQFNMIQGAMEKKPDGGYSGSGGYDEPAPIYGPPTTTTTTEAPVEESDSSAIQSEGPSVPAQLVYRNRPKYNFTFSLRTWDGEECEFFSEPEPNEGQNPRLRPLPIRSKRGIMKCTPIHSKDKGGQGFRAQNRTVVDDEKNPLKPFRAPTENKLIGRERTQVTDQGLESFITVANTNQQPPDDAKLVSRTGTQRGTRDSATGGRFTGANNVQQQEASQDSYLPPVAPPGNLYGPPRSQYGAPQVYGPPKIEYGPPPEKIEFDEAGAGNANKESGRTAGGYALMGGAAGEV